MEQDKAALSDASSIVGIDFNQPGDEFGLGAGQNDAFMNPDQPDMLGGNSINIPLDQQVSQMPNL